MANGGYFGTKDEWRRIEAPLIAIDPVFEKFAAKHHLSVTKNYKDHPERSVKWDRRSGVRYQIQLWLVDEKRLTFNLWICASEDRDSKRYWKQELLIEEKKISEFEGALPSLLEDAYGRLRNWSARELEFATDLPEL